MNHDAELQSRLDAAGVLWVVLTDAQRLTEEWNWRTVYGRAFRGRPRLRHGSRADFEFSCQQAERWLIVPLSSEVEGTSVSPHASSTFSGYECSGPLVALEKFHNVEFFVCPTDLTWTMLYTHEDHAFGGPYFIRVEWIVDQNL